MKINTLFKRTALLGMALLVFMMGAGAFITEQTAHANAANISLDADTQQVIISWDETSPSPVTDYQIELSGDGGGIWYTYPDAVSSQTSLTVPRSVFGYGALPLDVRITTVFADTSTHLSSVASFVIPSVFQPTTRFNLSSPELVVDNTERLSLGLNQWLDGTMGFFERNGQLSAVSANGRDTALVDIGQTNFIENVTYTNGLIQNQAISSDHSSGGPVYYDQTNDRLIMFYHGEIHDPDAFDFYSYIGLAVSTDGGATFEDLGQIIRPEITVNDPDRSGAVDVGPGAYMIRDGYFYVYFKDKLDDGTDIPMAVARSSVADVLSAAALGTTSTWLKYSGGSFSQPGVGGVSDSIFDFAPSYINWMDVIYLQAIDQYVMVTTSINNSSVGSMHYITTSDDGINWTVLEELYSDYSSDELPYVTLSGMDYANQKVATGNQFEIIRTLSTTAYSGNRWIDARVERITVSFDVPSIGPEPTPEIDEAAAGNDQLASSGRSVFWQQLSAVAALFSVCIIAYRRQSIVR